VIAPPPNGWPDLAGRLEAGAHRLPVRVYFEDTDFSGIVYHASYVRWCERGRSDYLRLLGVSHRDLAEAGGGEPAAFAVRRLQLEFLKPARIDDVLEIVTRPGEITKATIALEQTVWHSGVMLCQAAVLVVLVSQAGRPLRLPQRLREVFAT
jgi:acyl-CoA thioester hydrolase